MRKATLVSPPLIQFQEKHFAEVKALQVKLEEQQEKNNTLVQVNKVLRGQLNTSEKSNESLVQDLQRLTSQWDQFKNKDETAETSTSAVGKDNLGDQGKVASLWKDLLSVRRQFSEMKMTTERDLVSMRGK